MHANISYTFIFPNFASPKLESGLGSELPMILYTEKHWKYFSTSEYIYKLVSQEIGLMKLHEIMRDKITLCTGSCHHQCSDSSKGF